ncbi:MAG: hypothetical protein ACRES4_10360, partial [Nevskiales bacterium]
LRPCVGGARAVTGRGDMEAALEAVLFVSGEPVSRERLVGLFADSERAAAEAALAAEAKAAKASGRAA